MDKVSREIRSSVFIDFFGKDEEVGKKNFLELYNAIHGTNLKYEETRLELKEIDNTIYKTFQNDLGMLVNDTLVVLLEHQSTINMNMPLRLLEYITRIYSDMVSPRKRYQSSLQKLPTPEFYVFYNGKAPMEQTSTLRLSSAFLEERKHYMLDLEVTVFNINIKDLTTNPQSSKLMEYNRFIDFFYQHADIHDKTSCDKVLYEAIRQNLMEGYLERKVKEVRNMLCAEYSYEEDIAAKQEEAFDNGVKQGFASGIKQGFDSGIKQGFGSACVQFLLEGMISREVALKNLNVAPNELDDLIAKYKQSHQMN